MGGLSFTHLLIIMVILLIFFGPGRLPDLGNSLGKTIRDFKKALDDGRTALNEKPQSEKRPTETVAAETLNENTDAKKTSERKDPSS